MEYSDILSFWFEDIKEEQWFKKDFIFDTLVKDRFGEIHTCVAEGIDGWEASPRAELARIIVLDQFSRNMFRDSKDAFAYDEKALQIAQSLVASGDDKTLSRTQRSFVYMPYMHSESKEVHKEAVRLFTELGDESSLKYEQLHKRIIDEFGRYPHRNNILERESTEEERQFLANDGNASF